MGFIRNGQPLRAGKAFTDEDGTQYPRNWATVFSEEQKTSLGITWEPDPAPVDTRFYWDHDQPKSLEDEPAVDKNGDPVLDADGVQIINYGLKTQWIAKQKEIAGSLLAQSDWYVTRKAETGAAIPADVATYREAVRTISGTREAEIAATTSTADLKALLESQPKVYDEASDSMVDNPDSFITPWPEQA
jgi:hypothetical protein